MGSRELKFAPRKWQKQALEVWSSRMRGVVQVVTGGGKTFFALMCMKHFWNKYPQGRVVIIVPTLSLLDQWHLSLEEELDIGADNIACFSGQEKADEPRLVNIFVINTARSGVKEIPDSNDAFLIVDECHRAGSTDNSRALAGNYRATLGLSATPEREYDDGFEQRVRPALGDVVFTYSYGDAREDHVITPFKLINIEIDLLEHEQSNYDSLTRKLAIKLRQLGDGAVGDPGFKRLLQQRAAVYANATMRIPVASRLVDQHRGMRTIVFHERVDAANRIALILSARQHHATLYHSQVAPVVRRDNLRLYRAGLFDVLVTCRALDEGLNVPETQIAIVASSTSSLRQRIQRLGRVLRPAENKDSASVYTLYATRQERIRLAREAVKLAEISEVSWRQATVK